MSEKIAYERHPVSPERIAELHAQGFVIVDEIYKPRAAATAEQGATVEESPPAPTPPSEDDYRALVEKDAQTAEAGDHAAAARARKRNRN